MRFKRAAFFVTILQLPPLPNAPTPSMLSIDVPLQHDLVEKTGIFLCDYQENCVGYENFLNVCLSHPRLGNLRLFEKFLFEKEVNTLLILFELVKIVKSMEAKKVSEFCELV